MPSWRSSCSHLQRLDVLLAGEQRALQACEGSLYKLMEQSLDERSAAEKTLAALAITSEQLTIYDGNDIPPLPLRVDAAPHSLPASLRPHLQWAIRAMLLLREPPLLAWLLALRSSSKSPADEALLASAVTALNDGFNPADELRHRALLVTLCTLELRLLGASAARFSQALSSRAWRRSTFAGCPQHAKPRGSFFAGRSRHGSTRPTAPPWPPPQRTM